MRVGRWWGPRAADTCLLRWKRSYFGYEEALLQVLQCSLLRKEEGKKKKKGNCALKETDLEINEEKKKKRETFIQSICCSSEQKKRPLPRMKINGCSFKHVNCHSLLTSSWVSSVFLKILCPLAHAQLPGWSPLPTSSRILIVQGLAGISVSPEASLPSACLSICSLNRSSYILNCVGARTMSCTLKMSCTCL